MLNKHLLKQFNRFRIAFSKHIISFYLLYLALKLSKKKFSKKKTIDTLNVFNILLFTEYLSFIKSLKYLNNNNKSRETVFIIK